MELAAVGIVCLLVGVGLAYGVLSNISNSKIKTAEQQLKDAQTNADRIASEAARQAETVKKEAVLERAVVMVQAEVADRIAAKPSTKAYGAYTAKLSLFAQVTGRFEVGPGNFMPPPRVNSAVVRLDRTIARNPVTSKLLSEEELLHTMRVIDAAFAQRRKTIRNSMSASGFDKDKLDQAFLATGIAPTVRAEVLTSQDFICLAAALEPLNE